MHISTGVTKGRSHGDSTYPWQVHGKLHWHHWARMDPKIFGCMGTSIGVTEWRRTQGWGGCGYLY